ILRERGSVVGLTTAAAIFAEAAIGMAAGGGFYRLSGAGALLVLVALVLLVYVENIFNLKPRYMLFRISSELTLDVVSEVHKLFDSLKITLDNFQVSMAGDKNVIQFDADVSHRQQASILKSLSRPGVTAEMFPVERQHG